MCLQTAGTVATMKCYVIQYGEPRISSIFSAVASGNLRVSLWSTDLMLMCNTNITYSLVKNYLQVTLGIDTLSVDIVLF